MGWKKSGPYRYDGESLYSLAFPKPDLVDEFYAKYPNVSYSPYGIYTMYKDRKGSLWFGTASLGVCRYDGKSISWLYEKQLTETPAGGDFGIRSIIEDKDGYFWFCNTRYRYEILPNSTELNRTDQVNYRKENGIGTANDEGKDFPYFMSIAADNKGDLWMVTYDDGVWQNNGETLLHHPVKDGDKSVLLFSIYKDRQGVLWLGTHNAGVFKFNGKTFEKFIT
jgi:ligand-binding sensor domain-containing protein